MFKLLAADLRACMERDPAARSKLEVVLVYPGFHALVFHRLSHGLWRIGLKFVARFLSNIGRILTAIEIHPGARIGGGLFIDHGIGVVVGETAEIGEGVTLYHDVTLGGIAPSVDSAAQRGSKRHPTLMDNVIVGSGAQILGPITVGRGARVGANSVVLADVPSCATVVGIPARIVRGRTSEETERFQAYGVKPDLPDPVQRVVDGLLDRVQSLQARVDELERQSAERSTSRWSLADELDEDDEHEPAPKRGVKN